MKNTLALAHKLTTNSLDVLLKYPTWRGAIDEAISKGQLAPNYQPMIIEFFDQQGLLASRLYGYVFSSPVPIGHRSEFIALYFDGELMLFVIGNEIVLSRLNGMSVFTLFDLEG
jgi:hypothetical protein